MRRWTQLWTPSSVPTKIRRRTLLALALKPPRKSLLVTRVSPRLIRRREDRRRTCFLQHSLLLPTWTTSSILWPNSTMLVGAVSSSVQVKMTHSIMIGFWRRLGSATITKDSLAEGRLFLLWRAWAEMWHFLISFSHQTIFRPKVKVRYLVSQSWANSVFCSSCDWIIWIKRTCFGNGLGLCDSKNSSRKRILIIII